MLPEYDVEVDEDAKLVNVLTRNERILIVQLSYTDLEEIFEDEYQCLIRDAVRSQSHGDGENWNLASRDASGSKRRIQPLTTLGVAESDDMASTDEMYAVQQSQGPSKVQLVDGDDEGWAMESGDKARSTARGSLAQHVADHEPPRSSSPSPIDAIPSMIATGGLVPVLQRSVAADASLEDAWDMAPVSEVYDGFFSGFWVENVELWLQDRQHVALVRAEMDKITGIGKLLARARMPRHVEVQELYVEGKLDRLYRMMCAEEKQNRELSNFEKRLKEIIDRLFYAKEEVRQLGGVVEAYDCANDLCSENDLAEMAFWDAVETRGVERDFELALRLQEQEKQDREREREKAAARQQIHQMPRGRWGGRGGKNSLAFRSREPLPGALADFPSLPPGNPIPSATHKRSGSALMGSLKTDMNPTKLHTADKDDFSGYTKLSSMAGYLVDNLKHAERQNVLIDTDRMMNSSFSRGISMDKMRAMMAKTAKDSAKLSYCEQLIYNGPSREAFSRKSMEKLKKDMIEAGWINIRSSTHLIYRREMPVPECCGLNQPSIVQKTMVACTPSSPFALTRVFHAVYQNDVQLYERLIELLKAEEDRLEAARLAALDASSDSTDL